MIYHVAPYADNAGDIVIVDACQKLFREIDPGYFAIAERRIKDAQQQMRLPLEMIG